jgi:hypothetical protein
VVVVNVVGRLRLLNVGRGDSFLLNSRVGDRCGVECWLFRQISLVWCRRLERLGISVLLWLMVCSTMESDS